MPDKLFSLIFQSYILLFTFELIILLVLEVKVFPQTLKEGEALRIRNSVRDSINLYNTLGRQLYNGRLLSGLNVIPAKALSFTSETFYYRATYRNGQSLSDKVIVE